MKKLILYSLYSIGILLWCMFALIAQTPASLLADQVQKRSQGKITLTGVQGNLWRGKAQTVLYQQQPVLTQASWRLNPWRLFLGQAALDLQHMYGGAPSQARIVASPSRVMLQNSNLRLPIQPFTQNVAQLQHYALSGDMQLSTPELIWTSSGMVGNASLLLLNMQSNLSPGQVLGRYTLALKAQEKGYLLDISTQEGILTLTGKGEGQAKKRWDINVQVNIPPELQSGLSNLTRFLGPPAADGSYRVGYKF